MNVHKIAASALTGLVLTLSVTAAGAAAEPAIAPASQPMASQQVDLLALNARLVDLQLSESRRSEDRLLATVHWSLGAIVTMALALTAFSWWSATKLHQQDLQRIRDEVRKDYESALASTFTHARDKLRDEQQSTLVRSQAEANAFALWQIAKLRLDLGQLDAALDAAIDQAQQARGSNEAYVSHALKVITDVLNSTPLPQAIVTEQRVKKIKQITREFWGSLPDRCEAANLAVERAQRESEPGR